MVDFERALAERVDGAERFDPWKARCARELRGLSQAETAANAGMGVRGNETLSRAEGWHPQVNFGPKRVAALARALAVRPADLLSNPSERARSRERYAKWVADGRPDLTEWQRANPAA